MNDQSHSHLDFKKKVRFVAPMSAVNRPPLRTGEEEVKKKHLKMAVNYLLLNNE